MAIKDKNDERNGHCNKEIADWCHQNENEIEHIIARIANKTGGETIPSHEYKKHYLSWKVSKMLRKRKKIRKKLVFETTIKFTSSGEPKLNSICLNPFFFPGACSLKPKNIINPETKALRTFVDNILR